jgi:threonine/homoserine/homoserine lactone efflux protein
MNVWDAIGQVLPQAIGVALSPLPIVAVVLMLVTPRGKVNGTVFVVGWLAGLAIVGVLTFAIAGPAGASDDGSASRGASTVQTVLGVSFLLLAFRQWRTRPRAGAAPPPPAKWMSAVDSFTPAKALGLGALLAAVNPKNTLLAIGAATTIASTNISGAEQAVAYGVFAVIGTIGVAAPVVIAFAMGERSRVILDELKEWMEHNNAVIMTVLFLVLGGKLLGQGISGS